MVIDLTKTSEAIVGKTVPRPLSGTLSGHAAGEPFDKLVYQLIKEQLPDNTYRQFEYLNELYSKHADKLSHAERSTLIHSKTLQYLLNRGISVTSKWTPRTPFEEKQNDTADIIVTGDDYYQLIDVKTVNSSKKAQAPNIISASKIARMCRLMLENSEFNSHDLYYFEVDWELDGDKLRCNSSSYKNIFKTDPQHLYINWAAAMQIQFRVHDLPQNYKGTKEDWCHDYLMMFVTQAKRYIEKMDRVYVKAYEPLLK